MNPAQYSDCNCILFAQVVQEKLTHTNTHARLSLDLSHRLIKHFENTIHEKGVAPALTLIVEKTIQVWFIYANPCIRYTPVVVIVVLLYVLIAESRLDELQAKVEAQSQYINMSQNRSQSLIQNQLSPIQTETLSLRIMC